MKVAYPLWLAFFVALISRLFILAIALLSNNMIGSRIGPDTWQSPIPIINLFARWDSAYYINIAKFGYNQTYSWAFFPLYPIIMRLLAFILPTDISLSGFLLSNLFFFLFIIFFYKLTTKIFNSRVAFLSISLVSFFPSSIFLSAVYPESLFLFLTTISFYFLSQNKFFKSALIGFFVGLTKPFGFLIFISHVFNSLIIKKSKKFLISLIIPLSLILFFLFAYLITGDFLIFFKSQSEHWEIKPFDFLYNFRIITPTQKLFFILITFISVLAFVDFFKKKRWYLTKESKYYIFPLTIFLFYLNSPLFSFARFALIIFPIYWFLSKVWINHKKLGWLIFTVFLLSCLYCTTLFVNWYKFY